MNDVIALIGNPNCGKTTLFNRLTGMHQKIGNWTGVTTEKKEGKYLKDKNIKIVDLPGLYSLDANSSDEKAVINFIKKERPKVIINVVDGNSLERNLYLTTELCELKIPIVIAVNFADELEKKGKMLNLDALSNVFGTPVFAVSALKGLNVDEVVMRAIKLTQPPLKPFLNERNTSLDENTRSLFVKKFIDKVVKEKNVSFKDKQNALDRIILHRVFALPIFFMVMVTVYFLSIRIGGAIGGTFGGWFNTASTNFSRFLIQNSIPEWLTSLVCEGVIKGVGHIMALLPQILVLFALLAVMEESGYSARSAFIVDGMLRKIGLGGKSFIPMMLGCGCSVTGIMATRTIENEAERRMTVFLTPFMPCGVKSALFGWMSSVFFGGSAIIATLMYFLGIVAVVTVGRILKRFKRFSSVNGAFIMEIPPLRLPRLKEIFYVLWEKSKEFIIKAGLIIFILSVSLWFLRSFGLRGYTAGKTEESFLFFIGNALKYVFYPLGFGSWQASIALFSGIMAKEAIVETFEFLSVDLNEVFASPYAVYSFCAFVLLSPPCLAAITSAYRELGSLKWTALMMTVQTVTAYIVAFIINVIGIVKESSKGLLLSAIIVIILVTLIAFAIRTLKNYKCKSCKRGCFGGKQCREEERRFTT